MNGGGQGPKPTPKMPRAVAPPRIVEETPRFLAVIAFVLPVIALGLVAFMRH